VQDAVAAVGISRPSHVQAEAYKALGFKSGFRHVAVADQAGSGKTLAYLLPLLQQLKEREQQAGGPVTQPNSPSIIILTPTTGEGCCWDVEGLSWLGVVWCGTSSMGVPAISKMHRSLK
jgi:superfamily II DNA/RNA helicase